MFALIGLVVFVISIIVLIKCKIKNKGIAAAVILFGLMVFIVGVSSTSEEVIAPNSDVPVEQVNEEIEEEEADEDPIKYKELLADQAYRAAISENALSIGEAMNNLGEASQRFELTDEWILEMAMQMAIINFYAEEARKIETPEKFKEPHNLYLQAMDKYTESMEKLSYGIDNIDSNIIELAGTLMDEGSELIKQAAEKLSKIP